MNVLWRRGVGRLLPAVPPGIGMDLLEPTGINRVFGDWYVLSYHSADEEHLDIVLDSRQLGVVDPGFPGNLFARICDLDPNRTVPKFRLVCQIMWP